jgi:hypothetical protein
MRELFPLVQEGSLFRLEDPQEQDVAYLSYPPGVSFTHKRKSLPFLNLGELSVGRFAFLA